MYIQSQNNTNPNNKTPINSNVQQIQVTIRNLPNQAKTDDILEYLSIAGPIKSHKFTKQQERYSATVIYHDNQSAQLCKKYLGDEYYKGRALTITTQTKKNYNNPSAPPAITMTFEQQIATQISKLKNDEQKTLIGLLKGVRKDGHIFENFLNSHPKIVQAILGKYYSE